MKHNPKLIWDLDDFFYAYHVDADDSFGMGDMMRVEMTRIHVKARVKGERLRELHDLMMGETKIDLMYRGTRYGGIVHTIAVDPWSNHGAMDPQITFDLTCTYLPPHVPLRRCKVKMPLRRAV